MRVFNLAEELEKERKKNKELEERRKKDKYLISGLSIESKEKQDIIIKLVERIDKAIDFLESMDYCGKEDYFCDKTTVDEDPDGNNNSYYDSAERLYKILKGDNK